jgi:hypothetical protein
MIKDWSEKRKNKRRAMLDRTTHLSHGPHPKAKPKKIVKRLYEQPVKEQALLITSPSINLCSCATAKTNVFKNFCTKKYFEVEIIANNKKLFTYYSLIF